MTKKEYLEKRNAAATKAKEILALAEKEARGLKVEERESYEQIRAEIESLDDMQQRREEMDAIDADAATIAARQGKPTVHPTQYAPAFKGRSAYRAFIEEGPAGFSAEQRNAILSGINEFKPELRALATQTGSGGGYLINDEPLAAIESGMKYYGPMLTASDMIMTSTGADLPIPTDNDTTNSGAILAENIQIGTQDVSVGQIVMKAYTYTSKLVLVPWQLMQDSAFDVEGWLNEKLATRIGRILNTHFTTGTGQGQPNGIVTAAASGKTAASATAITYNELLDLEHSVDIAYRIQPGAGFMMNDSTVKYIKQLQDSSGRPLWQPAIQTGIGTGIPDTLDGFPYYVNNDMAAIATGNKTVLFGQFKKYKVRGVKGIVLVRMVERYADYLQTGFFAFARYDGNLSDAGTRPVKYLVQA